MGEFSSGHVVHALRQADSSKPARESFEEEEALDEGKAVSAELFRLVVGFVREDKEDDTQAADGCETNARAKPKDKEKCMVDMLLKLQGIMLQRKYQHALLKNQ